ncbi:TIGR03936 family radical SAM-associated protein [Anoxynatronum buryatiense]|uniref:Radical SAM-linked protein n=1 Tax=Anoxynatronum buryatiense TaxID=489973 RepID=A0AA45WVQ7_9CLOT|nr:TIGR03936 family radical SAM-associated protein [Anoxynatronum buryatiense]SMP49640.1 radical SAM-linked protein [Anoxynatronum buryatiense]
MMIRARYSKTGHMRFLSHLDLVRLFERAFRRAKMPLVFTQGYNPHPIISFAAPLSVGVGSIAEYVDVQLAEPVSPDTFVHLMNEILPPGIVIMQATTKDSKASDSLMQEAAIMQYSLTFKSANPLERTSLQESHQHFLELEELVIEKKQKKKNKQRHRRNTEKVKRIDIVPFLYKCTYEILEEDTIILKLSIYVTENGTIKPGLILQQWLEHCRLNIDSDSLTIKRTEIYRKTESGFEPILPVVNAST